MTKIGNLPPAYERGAVSLVLRFRRACSSGTTAAA